MTAPTMPRPADVVLDVTAAKKYLGKERDDDDQELAEFIDTAVELVELIRRETVVPVDVVETQLAYGSGAVMLDRTPILQVRSVTGDHGRGPWPVDELNVEYQGGRLTARGEQLRGLITVDYRAGRSNVPALYRQAAKVILAHLWKSQRQPLGRQTRFGSATDDGSEMVAGWSIPRAALELLGPPVPGVG